MQIGEKVTVKVIEIDNQGRINLAMNELREKREDVVEEEKKEETEENNIEE